MLRVERYESEAWVQKGVDLYDTNERNKDSAINRAGIAVNHGKSVKYVLWDDTEIGCTGT